ncbi:hypothetical protein MPSI1_001297 [Malassezia psittaci]|uniref:Uncharacterized protein n=1 Tax=Malassezia psittaci TaxID=1821823 RepID=A0AAF0F9Y6_9BASI|nr:hypothetical protein MPSI1_001297 [Malassezia psittaci]
MVRGSVLHFWDLGGALSMRSLWDQYLPDAQLLVWVVDAPRWNSNPILEEGPYRTAVSNAFMHLVLSAAARDLPILVVLSQVDQLSTGSAAASILQQDLHTFLLKQWAVLVDRTPSAATLTPDWHLATVSAATGDGIPSLLDTMHQHAARFAQSNPTQ